MGPVTIDLGRAGVARVTPEDIFGKLRIEIFPLEGELVVIEGDQPAEALRAAIVAAQVERKKAAVKRGEVAA